MQCEGNFKCYIESIICVRAQNANILSSCFVFEMWRFGGAIYIFLTNQISTIWRWNVSRGNIISDWLKCDKPPLFPNVAFQTWTDKSKNCLHFKRELHVTGLDQELLRKCNFMGNERVATGFIPSKLSLRGSINCSNSISSKAPSTSLAVNVFLLFSIAWLFALYKTKYNITYH